MKTILLKPEVLKWVRERGGLTIKNVADKLKIADDEVQAWERSGEIRLTRAQKLAAIAGTPIGYLFLEEPLSDELPIPDYRTVKDAQPLRPSPDLLETVETMQRRQVWMREFSIEEKADKLSFVGSASIKDDPEKIAARMRDVIGITDHWAGQQPTWMDALRHLREKIESAGILIFISGIVGNNTKRKLEPDEFRGFVLSDEYAPLLFVNGSDARSAQMFTMAHELVHIWLGSNGVSNFNALMPTPRDVEIFCNKVAAEFLIPHNELKKIWDRAKEEYEPFNYIARIFKVSPIVAARRALDIKLINRDVFFEFYDLYIQDERRKMIKKRSGGDFWKTQNVRIGYRFGTAVVSAAREGRLLYQDAYRLTGLKGLTFEKYGRLIGIPLN